MPKVGFAFALLLLLVTTATAQNDPNTASIQGTVTERTTAAPLKAALVVARKLGVPAISQTVRPAPDGSFLIPNLPSGTYELCARFAAGASLDSCAWGQAAQRVSLAIGQKSTGNSLQPITGSILKIRVQDTAQTLLQKTRSGAPPDLHIGVFSPPGEFHPARLVRRDTKGDDLELPVPFDTPLSLTVMSKALKLTDASTAAIPASGVQAQFQHAKGDPNPKSFTYTVVGLNP